MADRLRVCALYPDLMNIYADRGNLALLQKRCDWRGIGFELSGSGLGDALDPDAHDLFYIGGGQDRDQALCATDLATVKRDALHAAAQAGKLIFAVCGGYQLLGHSYELGGERLPGVGLVDLETVREDGPRLIGNVAIEVDLGGVAVACWRGSRTTAAARGWERRSAHSGASFAVMETTAAPGARAFSAVRTAPSSVPICMARSCPRTAGSRTGSPPQHWESTPPGWPRSTTRSRTPRTPPRGARPGSERGIPSIRWSSIRRPLPGTSS